LQLFNSLGVRELAITCKVVGLYPILMSFILFDTE